MRQRDLISNNRRKKHLWEAYKKYGCCGDRREVTVDTYCMERVVDSDGIVTFHHKFLDRKIYHRCGMTGMPCTCEGVRPVWDFFRYLYQERSTMSEQSRALIDPSTRTNLKAYQGLITQTRDEMQQAEAEQDELAKSLILAEGIERAQALMTPQMIQTIRKMEGSPLGYKTDKDHIQNRNGKYTDDQIKTAMIQASMQGLRFSGGEMMVMSGSCYACRPGLERLVKSHPGVANLEVVPSRPMFAKLPTGNIDESTKCVGFVVRFKFNERWREPQHPAEWVDMEILRDIVRDAENRPVRDERIPVRVNKGQGDDAVLGKAYRKIYKIIWETITGERVQTIDDAPDADVVDVEFSTVDTAQADAQPAAEDRSPF